MTEIYEILRPALGMLAARSGDCLKWKFIDENSWLMCVRRYTFLRQPTAEKVRRNGAWHSRMVAEIGR